MLHEPVAGGVVWKSILRIVATVAAGVLGLGAIYFTVLCNGLSYENRPAKFIAMTVRVLGACMQAGRHTAGQRAMGRSVR